MKVGIMQPYFLPYLGYFSLIHSTERWIVFDKVQFIRHGWIERNRVLNSNKEVSYIKIPLEKHSRNTLIKDIRINNNINWKKKILDQLTAYKRKAKYYGPTIELLDSVLSVKHSTITELNVHLLQEICDYLDLPFNYSIYSEMNLDIEERISNPGDWALEITKAINGDTYINPPGGMHLFDRKEFNDNGVNLLSCENHLSEYKQNNEEFVNGLSIIDVLMFNSPDETMELIKDYSLNEK